MIPPSPHPDEPERLAILRRCHVLDTDAEPDFDGLVALAAAAARAPIALISLVDADRQWFKAHHGLDATETPRRISFCGHAILGEGDELIVPDARKDPRFADNPVVVGALQIVFYAGIPLRVGPRRLPLGTLCVIDHRPRQLEPQCLRQLHLLARQAELLFELRLRQRELEERLVETRRSEEQIQAVIGIMDGGLVVQRDDGSIISCNPAAERILGITADQMTGRSSLDPDWSATRGDGSPFPGPEHPAMVALRTGAPVRGVVMGVGTSAGARRWILINAQPTGRGSSGLPTGVVCSFTDITDLRAKEAELTRARDAAEAAARTKSEFLATMSHEIRTPMNGVIGLTEVLLGTELGAEQRELLGSIRHSGQALLEILNAVLDWSRIEAGRIEVECLPVEVNALVREVTTLLAPQATAKGVALDVRPLPALGGAMAMGDAGRIRQVLFNLIGNAIKFTSAGQVTVSVSVEPESGGCRVVIRDTGIGIAPDDLARLFQRFSQVDASTTRRFGGSGLGLAISRELIHAMGGSVAISSTPGEGTSLTVDLPAASAVSPVEDGPSTGRRAGMPPRSLRVLLAEDNLINRRVAVALLEREGHRVEVAFNGREAVRSHAGGSWDLVLMDVQMPEMDGLAATRAIRQTERQSGARPVRVVALTASAMPDQCAACLAAGMDEILTKPITSASLRAVLDRVA